MSLPGPADPGAEPVLERRWLRARPWLATALFGIPLAGLVATTLLAGLEWWFDPGAGWRWLPVAPALVVVWLNVLALRRERLLLDPAEWPVRASLYGLVQAVFGLLPAGWLATGRLGAGVWAVVAGVPVLGVAVAWWARRRLMSPLPPEVGGSGFTVRFPLRTQRMGRAVLGRDRLTWWVRESSEDRLASEDIPLLDVQAVRATVLPDDQPPRQWATSRAGEPLWAGPGPAVLLRTTTLGELLLPTDHALALADLTWRRRQLCRRLATAPAAPS
ncbi:hypothetical protein GCM10012275_05880 [Longimycelium tulufanense]|uniref:Uncharacterized protein n=1 Tax=Longimycelium tulufanense TaxID=907463 RepID=A0A8J3CAJ5_9PSEU|nr:hypothetical protein GCM10012275_05880 [Longimycelium tulufanense]